MLRECLESIRRFPPLGCDLEVIVVDNNSADGSADMVASEFPDVQLIRHPTNSGYAEGNNLALQHVTGDLVLLLNPDVIMHEHALTNAVRVMQDNPSIGGLGCRLLLLDGTTQDSLRGFPDPIPVLFEYLGLGRIFSRIPYFAAYRMRYFDYDRAGDADQPMASFFLISRRCLEDVGGMDTDFPIFFNDVDWCYRAKRLKGWRIAYTPEAVVTHHHGGSTRQVKPRMIKESHRSLIRFYEKHYKDSMSPALFALIKAAILCNEWRNLRQAAKSNA